MDLNILNQVKKLVVIAIVSDDNLMEELVLKGGNAIDLIYKGTTGRGSLDIDFSIQGAFNDLELLKERISKTLIQTFEANGYHLFDISLNEKPNTSSSSKNADFWGGYCVEFKIISLDKYTTFKDNISNLRNHSIPLGPSQSKKFSIDISKYEYCELKELKNLEGYSVYVYPLKLIVLEKVRAICQQIPAYSEITETHLKSRARDFYDIYEIINAQAEEDFTSDENKDILRKVFDAKRVPYDYLLLMKDQKDIHENDFISVKNTTTGDIENFSFYFNFVIQKFGSIIL